MFNKILLSTLVLVNLAGQSVLQQTIIELVDANERDPEGHKKVLDEIGIMLQGLSLTSLDTKNRDLFT